MEDEGMPRIIVKAFLTLDGVRQAPGGPDMDPEGGLVHGGWQAPCADEVGGRLVTDGFADADGFLLGRKTYDNLAGHWPRVTDPDNAIATALRQVESVTTGKGGTYLRLERSGNPEDGQMGA
jgi:hypothetical protein